MDGRLSPWRKTLRRASAKANSGQRALGHPMWRWRVMTPWFEHIPKNTGWRSIRPINLGHQMRIGVGVRRGENLIGKIKDMLVARKAFMEDCQVLTKAGAMPTKQANRLCHNESQFGSRPMDWAEKPLTITSNCRA